MSVKQFNGTYFNQEDRILLRMSTINGDEFRLWLTRFMTRHLLIAIHQLIQKNLERKHNPQIAQVVQEFQEEGIKSRTNFQEEYVPATNLPLGEEGVLVTGLNLALKEDMFSIDFGLITQQNLNLQLNIQVVQSLSLLLQQLQENAQWNIDFQSTAQISSPISKDFKSKNLH